MVDWFNPVPHEDMMPEAKDWTWEQVKEDLIDFLKGKIYVKEGRTYLVITDFAESFIFSKKPNPSKE